MGLPQEKSRNPKSRSLVERAPNEDIQDQALQEPSQTPGRSVVPGSPHDGYAAVVLTLALTVINFGFGAGQRFLSTVETGHWWWIPFAVAVIVFPIGFFSLKYYLWAHGGNRLHGAPMPMFAVSVAWIALAMLILEPLAGALGSNWLFAGACLILATLIVAPVQMVLSKDPKRDSETT